MGLNSSEGEKGRGRKRDMDFREEFKSSALVSLPKLHRKLLQNRAPLSHPRNRQ